ncbi:hypothetical protein AN958_05410, partial [Leucoagaricus sp. SymC.cos]
QDEMFHPDIRAHVMKNTLRTKEVLMQMPMKPRKGAVMAGYNPRLDEKCPQEMKEYLSTYRILFVIDDSGSMQSHWDKTRAALEEISNHRLEFYSDALDIRFFNSLSHRERIKLRQISLEVLTDGHELQDMVDTISYSFYKCEGGGCLTAAVLKRIILGGLYPNLPAYWNQYRQRKHQKTSEVLY